MKTFFTSDTHFDHKNIIQYCHRPFDSVDEMNEALVDNWNRTIAPEDLVYHLGDFTLGDIRHFNKWADQLNGHLRILPGSHDDLWLKNFVSNSRVQVLAPLVSLEIPEIRIGAYHQV